jgi:hypothetical protein
MSPAGTASSVAAVYGVRARPAPAAPSPSSPAAASPAPASPALGSPAAASPVLASRAAAAASPAAAGGSRWRAVAELVRAPAALSVPGDVLVGAAAAGWPFGARTAGLAGASTCLYWAGMALNDWSDRHVDAVERPHRPIPSGRIPAPAALAIAGGLTLAGVGLAGATGGRRALSVAVPLAATVWAYDLGPRSPVAGPAAMCAARALDVLLGAGGHPAALPAAGTVAAHTAVVMGLSAVEATGGPAAARRTRATLAGTAAVTALAVLSSRTPAGGPAAPSGRTVRVALSHLAGGPSRGAFSGLAAGVLRGAFSGPAGGVLRSAPSGPPGGVLRSAPPGLAGGVLRSASSGRVARAALPGPAAALGAALLAAYAGTLGAAQVAAARDPRPATVQKAVGAGVLGIIPLEAALLARRGAPRTAAAVAALWPPARRLSRRVSAT